MIKNIASFFNSQFFRFIIVSVLGGIVDLGTYFLLTKIFSFHYLLAGFVAFVCAATVNFFFAKKWAFKCNSTHVSSQFRLYFLVGFVGLILHQFLLWLGMLYVPGWEVLIKIFASWASVLWSYVVNKRVTFN